MRSGRTRSSRLSSNSEAFSRSRQGSSIHSSLNVLSNTRRRGMRSAFSRWWTLSGSAMVASATSTPRSARPRASSMAYVQTPPTVSAVIKTLRGNGWLSLMRYPSWAQRMLPLGIALSKIRAVWTGRRESRENGLARAVLRGLRSVGFDHHGGLRGGFREAAEFHEPVVKVAHALPRVYTRAPPGGRGELREVRDVVALVAGAPVLVEDLGPAAMERADQVDQLEERDGVARAAPHVERLAGDRADVLLGEQEGLHQVLHVQDVAHLHAVAVEGERPAVQGADKEVGDPPLVLGAELVGPVDAAHAEDRRAQAVTARVVEHVLVRRPLRAAVGAVEVEPAVLGEAAGAQDLVARLVALPAAGQGEVLHAAVDLVGRGEEEGGGVLPRAHGVQHVEGAAHVDVEVVPGIDQAGGHRHLGREVEDGLDAGHRPPHGERIAHVGHFDGNAVAVGLAQPVEVVLHAGAREVVEQPHAPPRGGDPVRQVGADEAGAAGDQDGLSAPCAGAADLGQLADPLPAVRLLARILAHT